MEVPDLNKLLDNRSKPIWDEVQNHYRVTLKFHDANHYSCEYNGKEVIMYVTKDGYNPNYFAHEILHLYIRINGSDIGDNLITLFRSNPKLLNVLNEQLLHRVTNTLEHFKMLPIYLERGFAQCQFIVNYEQPVADIDSIISITTKLSDNSVASRFAAEDYILVFFTMKANSNPKINYADLLELLKEADASLYKIIDDFWSDWVNFDATIGRNNLSLIVIKFYDSLAKWIDKKYQT
jgi:hypothetical protein